MLYSTLVVRFLLAEGGEKVQWVSLRGQDRLVGLWTGESKV